MKYTKCGKHQRKTRDARARAPFRNVTETCKMQGHKARTMQDLANNIEIQ
jgi:hypothetical protein